MLDVTARLKMEWLARAQPISPLVGEMPGRAEGGNVGANAAIDPSAAPLLTPLCHLTVTSPPHGGRLLGDCRTTGVPFAICKSLAIHP